MYHPSGALGISTCKGETNEYWDDLIRGSGNCVDWRLHRVSRGRRVDSLVIGLRGDFPDSPLCHGATDDRLGVYVSFGGSSLWGRILQSRIDAAMSGTRG
jgi:hypothetical protein